MSRPRHRMRSVCGGAPTLCCSLLLVLAAGSTAGAEPSEDPPNILLIISDDQAFADFGFMGSEEIRTPAIDRLAAEGFCFERGYVPTALCRPSLMTLATGLYPHQHGVTGNDPPRGVHRDALLRHIRAVDPLPARLARAGYRCLQTGKWWEGNWSEGGFTEGMTHGDPGRRGRHGDEGLRIGREGLEPITSFIDDCQAEGSPFFVWYAPFLPHRPHNPPQRLFEHYKKSGVPDTIARYRAMCEWLDETVAGLLAHLDARDLARETLVLFLVDNGWITDPETGGYAPRSKRSANEGGVRTPILLRMPGTVEAGRSGIPVSSVDLAPTILTACGLASADLPGVDLAAVARGERPAPAAVHGASYSHDVLDIHAPGSSLLARWVIEGGWKLIEHAAEGATRELYQVEDDPWEERQLAAEHPARARALAETMEPFWAPEDVAPPPRPNLILVLTDDQRFDQLGCAGHPVLKTPTMDRLARGGVRFQNAFVTTSICAASRASILTGRYERSHGYTFGTQPISVPHARTSYPALLRAAGYRTGFTGKWGVRVADKARGEMFEWIADRGHPYLKPQQDGSTRHLTDIVADDAIRFLETTPQERPFCLSISFHAPHAQDSNPDQYVWPPALDGLYDDAPVAAPPLADPAWFEALPDFLKNSENRVRHGWRFDSEEKRLRMTRGYWRMITGVDQALGRVLEALERSGRADNTVIVFTSDNGYYLGERGFAGKWYIHEESIRVPLIVYDPRAEPDRRGVVTDAMVLNVDLAPTLLDLAGVPAEAGHQGASLGPWLEGEAAEWRADFLYEHHFEHPRIPRSEGVRGERFVYARFYGQEPLHEWLYDLEQDPLQEHNLAAEPASSQALGAARARLEELIEAAR